MNCTCGAANCWQAGDFSWLASASGWHGPINGLDSSVFFIHGKKIREQRHLPSGHYDVAKLCGLLSKWSEGLPDAQLVWCEDTGGGDAGLWIEGVREPMAADWARLEEARERIRRNDERELKAIQKRMDLLSKRPPPVTP